MLSAARSSLTVSIPRAGLQPYEGGDIVTLQLPHTRLALGFA